MENGFCKCRRQNLCLRSNFSNSQSEFDRAINLYCQALSKCSIHIVVEKECGAESWENRAGNSYIYVYRYFSCEDSGKKRDSARVFLNVRALSRCAKSIPTCPLLYRLSHTVLLRPALILVIVSTRVWEFV